MSTPPVSAPPAIAVHGVNKQFARPGEAPLRVLTNLDLEVAEQELVCILGPSGSGKSTLLNLIAGLEADYAGRIAIGGRDRAAGDAPVRVGYLFQEPRLLPWLTAERNVDFALDGCKVPRIRRAALKDHYFALVGLSEFRGYYPHQLSGGMRQRVALVRALCVEPAILLMDEPFGGLDELTARRLRVDLLRIWRETNKTIVFVTHNAYEASFLADRILIMAHGRIRDVVTVPVPRPRDYDDPAVFDVNRDVVRRFLAAAEPADAVAPTTTSKPLETLTMQRLGEPS